MPWPPTGVLAPLSLAEQLAAPETPGVDSQLLGEVYKDPLTGFIAPGVMEPTTVSFDALPQPDEPLLKPVDASAKRQMVIEWATQWVGKADYVWGGESMKEGGFDCSGLLWAAFKNAGISMPRVSYSQARRGARVALRDLQPGDLVAWDHNPDVGADHIALYIGNGQIVEAARRGTKVRIRKLGANEGAWGVHLNY
jgi:cell wall-associated NlpC family hydrolase